MFCAPHHTQTTPQKTASPARLLASGLICLVVLLGNSGCRTASCTGLVRKPTSEQAVSQYSALMLSYETTDFTSLFSRLNPGNVSQTLGEKLHLTSAEETEERPCPTGQWSQARIQIIYPHPDGSLDKGLARLIVTRKSPHGSHDPERESRRGNFSQLVRQVTHRPGADSLAATPASQGAQGNEEIWQLDLAKDELDILLTELSHRGFFEQQERPRGEAQVTIKLNDGAISKRWTSEPRLDGLMMQVYNQGELSAFTTRTHKASDLTPPVRSANYLDG